MKRICFIAVILLFCAVSNTSVVAQELTGDELEVWTALEEQIDAFFARDMTKHATYLHPKSVWWGASDYAPALAENSLNLLAKNWQYSESTFIGFHITPLSVTVVDDVAIINFIFYGSNKNKDGGTRSWSMKGHNTWKKENGEWLLLAIYNTGIE